MTKPPSDEIIARIRASLVGWYPGKWAEEVDYPPACCCGATRKKVDCARHPPKAG